MDGDEVINISDNEESVLDCSAQIPSLVDLRKDCNQEDELRKKSLFTGVLPYKELKFEKEIKQMLSVYEEETDQVDDACVQVLDDIVCDFITETTRRASKMGKQGRVSTEDLLYAISNDKVKYYRAKELLKMNKQLKSAKKLADADVDFDI